MKSVTFVVPGEPVGKQRPGDGKYGRYTPAKTRLYEEKVRAAYRAACPGEYFHGRFSAGYRAYYRIPDSWSKKKKEAAEGDELVIGKPDADNILKIILDALNGVAYDDDRFMCHILDSDKFYAKQGEQGRVEVTIMEGRCTRND